MTQLSALDVAMLLDDGVDNLSHAAAQACAGHTMRSFGMRSDTVNVLVLVNVTADAVAKTTEPPAEVWVKQRGINAAHAKQALQLWRAALVAEGVHVVDVLSGDATDLLEYIEAAALYEHKPAASAPAVRSRKRRRSDADMDSDGDSDNASLPAPPPLSPSSSVSSTASVVMLGATGAREQVRVESGTPQVIELDMGGSQSGTGSGDDVAMVGGGSAAGWACSMCGSANLGTATSCAACTMKRDEAVSLL